MGTLARPVFLCRIIRTALLFRRTGRSAHPTGLLLRFLRRPCQRPFDLGKLVATESGQFLDDAVEPALCLGVVELVGLELLLKLFGLRLHAVGGVSQSRRSLSLIEFDPLQLVEVLRTEFARRVELRLEFRRLLLGPLLERGRFLKVFEQLANSPRQFFLLVLFRDD